MHTHMHANRDSSATRTVTPSAWLLAFWLALIAFTHPPRAHAAAPPEQRASMAWIEDVQGQWTIQDLAAMPAERFTRSVALSAGYKRSVYWVRLTPPADWPQEARWLEMKPPFLDQVDVYEMERHEWRVQRLGDMRPRSQRLMDYRHFVVPLLADPNGRDTRVFVRIQTTSAMLLDASWWTPADFALHASRESTLWGFYFGVAAMSVLLTFGLAMIVRGRKLWALTSFSVAYVLVASNQGFLGWLLLPQTPYLAHMLPGLAMLLGQAATLWLVTETLDFREHLPRLHKVYTALILLMVLACLSVPLDFYTELSTPALLVIEISKWWALGCGILLWRRHGRMYGAITAAYGFHMVTILLTALTLSGAIPLYPLTFQVWQYGLIVLMLVVAGVSLAQVRQDHLRRLSDKTEALLATEQARAMLAERVARRTRELVLTRDQLEQSLQDEQEAHFQQRQLVGLVSHEFRTPLAVIDMVLNNLLISPPETLEDMQQRLSQIRDANRHLVQLADTCLADARLSAGLLTPTRTETLNLHNLVVSTLDMLYGSASAPLKTAARPRFECPDAPEGMAQHWLTRGDAGLLRIALCNVLENARKYADPDNIHLVLRHHPESPLLAQLQIEDIGPGIAPEERDRIFERFARGPETGRTKGNGLGLFVSREIMRAHGGELRLLSTESPEPNPSGCVFEFEWMLEDDTSTKT